MLKSVCLVGLNNAGVSEMKSECKHCRLRAALPHGATGLSAFCDCPDHTHLLLLHADLLMFKFGIKGTFCYCYSHCGSL